MGSLVDVLSSGLSLERGCSGPSVLLGSLPVSRAGLTVRFPPSLLSPAPEHWSPAVLDAMSC